MEAHYVNHGYIHQQPPEVSIRCLIPDSKQEEKRLQEPVVKPGHSRLQCIGNRTAASKRFNDGSLHES